MRPFLGRDAPAALALAWAGSVGALFLSLQPIVVGAWVDRAGLSLQEAGFGGGLLMASAAASAASLANPDRAFALVLFCQTLTGALALYFAPGLLGVAGLTGVFLGLAALAASVMLVAPFFAEPRSDPARGGGSWRALFSSATLLLLASLWVHYVANNGMWAHLERIGVGAGVTAAGIGTALAIGQGFGLAGSALAMALAQRADRRAAIAAGVVLTAASAVLLTYTDGALLLGAGVALFIGSLSFAVPFYFGALAARDPSGRLIVTGQLAIMAGLFVGPSVAAWIVTAASMNAMLWTATAGFAVSLALAVAALRQATRSAA